MNLPERESPILVLHRQFFFSRATRPFMSLRTEVPVLQDVQGPKSMAPPPTALTPGPNWLKFCVEAPQEDTFRGIEAIFEFHLRTRDMGATLCPP